MNADSAKRGRPRGFEVEAVLDKAIDVFWLEGYDGADYAKLIEAMGMSKPSIYNAFGDKQSLFMHTLRRYAQTFASAPGLAMLAEEGIEAKLRTFFRVLIENMASPDHPHGCLMISVASDTSGHNTEVREFLAGGLRQADASFEATLTAAVTAGELPEAFPAADRAKLWTDLVQATAARARAGSSREELNALALRACDAILA